MMVAMKLRVGRSEINPAHTAQGLPDGGSGFRMGFEERLRMYLFKNVPLGQLVAHTYNPSTWESEAGGSLRWRPAWSTE